jgi:hypothetical protein
MVCMAAVPARMVCMAARTAHAWASIVMPACTTCKRSGCGVSCCCSWTRGWGTTCKRRPGPQADERARGPATCSLEAAFGARRRKGGQGGKASPTFSQPFWAKHHTHLRICMWHQRITSSALGQLAFCSPCSSTCTPHAQHSSCPSLPVDPAGSGQPERPMHAPACRHAYQACTALCWGPAQGAHGAHGARKEGELAACFNGLGPHLAVTSSWHCRVSDGDLLHVRQRQLQGPTRQRPRLPVGTCIP